MMILGLAPRETAQDHIEKQPDRYVAHPVGIEGVVVGEGDSHDEVLAGVTSAIRFHIETSGPEALEVEESVLEA